jgi:hypothetical protein
MRRGRAFQSKDAAAASLILIQDLHCNVEAQIQISQALRQIYKETGVSKVFIEGAQGWVNTTLYQAFPNENIRRKVALEFMKMGYLTGAELALIEMGLGNKMELYGIENTGLYLENFKAFRETRQMHESLKAHLNEIDTWIDQLKEKRYSENLKTFDGMQEALDENEPDIKTVLRELEKFLDENTISIQNYKNVIGMMEVLKLWAKLDQTALQRELETLIQYLQKRSMEKDLKKMVTKTLQYRLQKLSLLEYLKEVKKSILT